MFFMLKVYIFIPTDRFNYAKTDLGSLSCRLLILQTIFDNFQLTLNKRLTLEM